jgi:putative flippase GtrA
MQRHGQMLRFVAVGFANAAISFGVLNLCVYKLGQNKIISSIIATSCALLFSFAMNRSFVFADTSRRARQQFVPFVVVTVTGSLVIINVVYILTLHLLDHHDGGLLRFVNSSTGLRLSHSFLDINFSTVVGAIAAMVWNYNGYRLFVFKKDAHAAETTDEAN